MLNSSHALSLLTAGACLTAAFCGGWRHILARDKPESWPSSAKLTNLSLFLLVGGLLYLGVRLIVAVVHNVQTIPPNATPQFATIAVLIAMFMIGLLYNEFVQRGPWVRKKLKEDGFYVAPLDHEDT